MRLPDGAVLDVGVDAASKRVDGALICLATGPSGMLDADVEVPLQLIQAAAAAISNVISERRRAAMSPHSIGGVRGRDGF